MAFERDIAGFRYAETHYGDDLRRLALRELGDASTWMDIAAINGLVHPYITDDAALVRPGVVLSGTQLLIPAPQSAAAITTNPDEVFGTDVALVDGQVQYVDGDLALVGGNANFLQSLMLRLDTHKKDLMYHPEYGNETHLLVGRINGPVASSLAVFYTRSCLLEDDRVIEVRNLKAKAQGEQILIEGDAVGISGKPIQFSTVV
jgi:hypothetical protein